MAETHILSKTNSSRFPRFTSERLSLMPVDKSLEELPIGMAKTSNGYLDPKTKNTLLRVRYGANLARRDLF
jgi:hypothetical protein